MNDSVLFNILEIARVVLIGFGVYRLYVTPMPGWNRVAWLFLIILFPLAGNIALQWYVRSKLPVD